MSTPEQPCCTQDEGRPLAAALQEEAANHLTRRWLRGRVVSGEEGRHGMIVSGTDHGDERKRTIAEVSKA